MHLRFIGQGLDPTSDNTAGNIIIESLSDDQFKSFNAFVAFVSIAGLNNILEQLTAFKEREGQIRLYIGVDLNGTSKEALDKLLELDIESYIIFSPNNIIYHPKVFAFEGDDASRALIGSTNLTERGLFQSIEASVRIDFDNSDEAGTKFLSDVYDHFNTIINHQHPSCQRLTQEILDILVESKVVLPEAVTREKTNKANKEFGQKETRVNKRLLDLFGKVQAKRPPKGFKKSAIRTEYSQDATTNQVAITEEAILLSGGSMWIQTGEMTSPARNILGLSKKGILPNNDLIDGSVSFYGINPDVDTQPRQIDVEYAGELYIGNQVHYTPKNGSWRLNFYGVTISGKRFTDITRPTMGIPGAFQNKILLFTRTGDSQYRLEVLDEADTNKLKDLSSVWARNGASSWVYGYIS